jgi:DNA (cytosine-5)-methyltransferase 1
VQIILLNAAFCDVAQTRERVFIIGRRKDLKLKPIQIVSPNNKALTVEEVFKDLKITNKKFISEDTKQLILWKETVQGNNFAKAHERLYKKNGHWNFSKLHPQKPAPTLTSQNTKFHWDEPRYLTKEEIVRLGSFPDDYEFESTGMAQYLCGMSVPPKMMKVIAEAIQQQWFDGMD